MPPLPSDNEDASDVEVTQASASKNWKLTSYEDETPEDDDAASADEKNGPAGAEDEEAGDEDEDLEEEEYVVETIMSHMIDKKGNLLFEVKWEGYEKKSDRTWEPEENLLDNASETLKEYYDSVGGRDKIFEETANAAKSKKRGRPPSSTPQASTKRSRRNGDHPADLEPPLSAKAVAWKPPAGSWEEHIAQLDACEDEETGKLMVYLTWKNGHKTQHSTSVIYERCPQKMLRFYEQHVRIVRREADADSVTNLA